MAITAKEVFLKVLALEQAKQTAAGKEVWKGLDPSWTKAGNASLGALFSAMGWAKEEKVTTKAGKEVTIHKLQASAKGLVAVRSGKMGRTTWFVEGTQPTGGATNKGLDKKTADTIISNLFA